jgi:hypothetical protein
MATENVFVADISDDRYVFCVSASRPQIVTRQRYQPELEVVGLGGYVYNRASGVIADRSFIAELLLNDALHILVFDKFLRAVETKVVCRRAWKWFLPLRCVVITHKRAVVGQFIYHSTREFSGLSLSTNDSILDIIVDHVSDSKMLEERERYWRGG